MNFKKLFLMAFSASAAAFRPATEKNACVVMPSSTILCPPPIAHLPFENEVAIKNFNSKILHPETVSDEQKAKVLESLFRLRMISEEHKNKIDELLALDQFAIDIFSDSPNNLKIRQIEDARAQFVCSRRLYALSVLQIPITAYMDSTVLDSSILHELSHATDLRHSIQLKVAKEITCESSIPINVIANDIGQANKILNNPQNKKQRAATKKLSTAIEHVNASLTPYARNIFLVQELSEKTLEMAKAALADGKYYKHYDELLGKHMWITAVRENGNVDAALTDPAVPLNEKGLMSEAEIRKDLEQGLAYLTKIVPYYPKEFHSAEYLAYIQQIFGKYPEIQSILFPEILKAQNTYAASEKKMKPK